MEEKNIVYKKVNKCLHYKWLIAVFAVPILFFCFANIFAGLFILISGLVIALIYFARSDEDEKLGTRVNYELIQFYTRAAYFLLVVLGISLLIFVIAEKIIMPLQK
ncbi:MAG: hypothetical protein GX996_01210 [Firmicutes bacterium]|nr:hypothetical protein [Bacillota bacterium]